MLNIYLAGSMTSYYSENKPDLAENWRLKVSDSFYNKDVKVFNPCINYPINKTYDAKGVVYQNLHYLNHSDIMILNLDRLEESQGTLFEIFNFFMNRKPVIAFGSNPIYNQPHVHESITIKFDTLDEVIKYIKNMYHLK
jgi:nucleoside 2-deoxyribosyltransferase